VTDLTYVTYVTDLTYVTYVTYLTYVTYVPYLTYVTFLDGYCSTVQALLDWFEVDLRDLRDLRT